MRLVYIVMCYNPMKPLCQGSSQLIGAEERFHIDSVWTSERKAYKRKDFLNSDEYETEREDYGYGFFTVEIQTVKK